MASAERDTRLAGVYRRAGGSRTAARRPLGRPARAARRRPARGAAEPPRARSLAWLASHFGASLLLPTLAAREQLDRRRYTIQPEAGDALREEEQRTASLLKRASCRRHPRGGRRTRWRARNAAAAGSAATPCARPCSAPTTASSRTSAWSWAWRAPQLPRAHHPRHRDRRACLPARCRWRWANGSPSRARASSTRTRSTSSAWRSPRCPSSRRRSSR